MDLPFPEAPPNFLGMALQARQIGQQDRRQRARDSALGMMAFDPEGAKSQLLAAGDFAGAQQVDQQIKGDQQKKVFSQYATDPAGAKKAAFDAGDPQLISAVGALDEQGRQEAAQRADVFARVGMKLKQFPYDQRKAALQAMAPAFEQNYKIPADQVANFDPTDANIEAKIGQASTLKDMIAQAEKATADKRAQDTLDETVRHNRAVEGKPEYKTITRPDGKTEIVALGEGQGAPSGGLSQGGFDAIYGSFTAPHELGYTASDGNGAPANFGINQKANPDVNVAGLTPDKAKQVLHDRYWVPSGAEQIKDPALQAVQFDTAVNMGVGAANHLLQESGGDPQKYLQLREDRFKAIAAADPSKASRLPNWLRRNQDLGQFIAGQGRGGGASPDARVVYQGQGADAGGLYGAAASGPQGEDFLKTLPRGYAEQVKATAKGDLAMPSGFVMKTPYGQKLIADIMQYDPTANAINLPTRQATRKAFVAGTGPTSPRGQLGSINTVTSHLASLYDAIDGLRNFSGAGVLLNKPANAIAGATDSAYQKARARYDAARTAVAEDLPNVLRGGAGAEADVKHWRAVFDPDQSPDALKTAVRSTASELVKARLDPLREQYKQGMGTTDDVFQTMFPQGAAALAKIMGKSAPASSARKAPGAPAAAKPDPLGIR